MIPPDTTSRSSRPDRQISMAQLDSANLTGSEKTILRTVFARDEFGDVKVWTSHQITWFWVSDDPHLHTSTGDFFDLFVIGAPKAIATKLVTKLPLNTGLFEAPISMTLAHGLNWAHKWDQGPRSEKARVLDQLHWMGERVHHHLNYDRYHFSYLLIEDLLGLIDRAIEARNWLAFIFNIDRLVDQEEMKRDV